MARRSVTRKPVKSILLFFVVLIISLFLLSGMAGRTANVKTQDNTRKAVGVGFLLESNLTNQKKRMIELEKKIELDDNNEGTYGGVHVKIIDDIYGPQYMSWTDNSFNTLIEKDILKISEIPGISDYNITTGLTVANPVNFSRIESEDVDQNMDFQCVSLIGNLDMKMDTNVLSGNLTIKTGRMVSRDDVNVCVISDELASKNNLKTGDKLKFNDYHDRENSKVYEAEIIGIYTVQQYMTPSMSGDTFRSENVIFTDLRFPEKAEGCENDPFYEKAYFKIDNADNYDDIKEKIKHVNIDWERYDLIDNNGNYDTLSSNFKDLKHISEALISIVILASFIILFLIFVFWLKSRVQEAGVLLSLGISKFKIISQIWIEAFIISISAIFISFSIAPGISKLTADYLVDMQITQEEKQKELDKENVEGGKLSEEKIMGVSVNITKKMMIFDGGGIIVLTSLSVLTAGTSLLRRKPKDILSEMD